ncbi:ABC transporter transmembrane domain-containing protein [Enterococcus faecium]
MQQNLFALITFFSAIVSILSAVISFNLGANISILQSNFSVSDKNIRLIAMMVLFVFLGILQIIINYFKTVFIIKGTVKFETHLFEKYLDKILSIHSKYFR